MFTTINNKFKVVITSDTATLEYYQSIYTHSKQKFNIPDRIEVVKKSVYQYIENCINNYLFGNYNILEVRSNLYNNLVYYSQLGTEDLNKTSNKGKQKPKQHSRTTPNTPILPKTTAKHLQTSEQGTSVKLLLSIILFPISLAQSQTPNLLLNCFSRPEDFQSPRNPTQQQEPISTSTNIIEYLQKNESDHSENLESKKTESEQERITKNKEEMATAYIAKIPEFTSEDNDTREPFENWQAIKDAFLQQFTNNNISITLYNHFCNIKQEISETVMTYLRRFNKLFRQIRQLETNDYYSDAQILDQFIARLKDKLIKKVCPHAPKDLTTAIRHAKNYEMAMEEANHTKLVNLAIEKTSSAAEKKIDQLTKKVENYFTNQQQQQQSQRYQPLQRCNQNNFGSPSNNQPQNCKVAAPRLNPSNNTILSAQIAQNTNLSDIFPFKFEANELPFLLSNAVINEQKTITVMYTEITVERKPIQLILNNRLAGNKAPVFEFKEEKEMSFTETYMALGLTSNWAEETEQEIFEESRKWKKVRYSTPKPQKKPPYIPLKCKDCKKKLSFMRACIFSEEEYETCTCYFCKACHRKRFRFPKRSRKWDNTPCLTCRDMLSEEYNWIDVAMRGGVCDQICQYALSISEKFRRGTLFDAAYNSALNKLYHYPYDAEMIFDLAMVLINETTQGDVHQIKEAEYIEYTIELAGFDYKDKVETYHQITSHIYPTKEAQIQQLKQMNIQLCKECVMPYDDQWCLECYALSIPLPDENDENEIEFGVFELVEELPTTPIYLLENQPPLQLKYFDNYGQRIRPKKAYEINARYDLKYPRKDTLVLQPKLLTRINLKIALEIPLEAMVQIAFRLSLANKGINIRGGIIDAEYTENIIIILQTLMTVLVSSEKKVHIYRKCCN
ncbi:hypothetical protein G9A89_003064 [Geosiphon pyriformis]|nr:hypothetical protein G9A89_003064 [Geosiphon pyriformis]